MPFHAPEQRSKKVKKRLGGVPKGYDFQRSLLFASNTEKFDRVEPSDRLAFVCFVSLGKLTVNQQQSVLYADTPRQVRIPTKKCQ